MILNQVQNQVENLTDKAIIVGLQSPIMILQTLVKQRNLNTLILGQ